MKVICGIALLILTLASWLHVKLILGLPSSALAILLTIPFWLVALALAFTYKRVKFSLRIYSGLLILALLFLPNSSLTAHLPFSLPQSFQNILETFLFLLLSLALAMAAWLLHSAISRYKEGHEAGTSEAEGSQVQRKLAGLP